MAGWNKVLRPYAENYAAITGGIWELSIKELQRLRSACKKPNQTNCWWATFNVAQMILPEVERALREKLRVRRAANRATRKLIGKDETPA